MLRDLEVNGDGTMAFQRRQLLPSGREGRNIHESTIVSIHEVERPPGVLVPPRLLHL